MNNKAKLSDLPVEKADSNFPFSDEQVEGKVVL